LSSQNDIQTQQNSIQLNNYLQQQQQINQQQVQNQQFMSTLVQDLVNHRLHGSDEDSQDSDVNIAQRARDKEYNKELAKKKAGKDMELKLTRRLGSHGDSFTQTQIYQLEWYREVMDYLQKSEILSYDTIYGIRLIADQGMTNKLHNEYMQVVRENGYFQSFDDFTHWLFNSYPIEGKTVVEIRRRIQHITFRPYDNPTQLLREFKILLHVYRLAKTFTQYDVTGLCNESTAKMIQVAIDKMPHTYAKAVEKVLDKFDDFEPETFSQLQWVVVMAYEKMQKKKLRKWHPLAPPPKSQNDDLLGKRINAINFKGQSYHDSRYTYPRRGRSRTRSDRGGRGRGSRGRGSPGRGRGRGGRRGRGNNNNNNQNGYQRRYQNRYQTPTRDYNDQRYDDQNRSGRGGNTSGYRGKGQPRARSIRGLRGPGKRGRFGRGKKSKFGWDYSAPVNNNNNNNQNPTNQNAMTDDDYYNPNDCYKCKQLGHFRGDCPNLSNKRKARLERRAKKDSNSKVYMAQESTNKDKDKKSKSKKEKKQRKKEKDKSKKKKHKEKKDKPPKITNQQAVQALQQVVNNILA